MKWYWWLFILVFFVVAMAFMWIQLVKSRIQINFKIGKVDWGSISVTDFLIGKELVVELNTFIIIKNQNPFSIPIKDLNIEIYYRDELIARSTEKEGKLIKIPTNGEIKFDEKMTLFANQNSFNLITNFGLKGAFELKYIIKLKLYNAPVSFKGTYKHTEK